MLRRSFFGAIAAVVVTPLAVGNPRVVNREWAKAKQASATCCKPQYRQAIAAEDVSSGDIVSVVDTYERVAPTRDGRQQVAGVATHDARKGDDLRVLVYGPALVSLSSPVVRKMNLYTPPAEVQKSFL